MNKQELFDAMKGRISMTAIQEYSGEYQIIGKFGMVSWMDDYWDIWITGVHHGKELSQRKVNSLARRINDRVKVGFQELTGESCGNVPDSEGAFICAVLLGARRKRKASVETLARLRKTQFQEQPAREVSRNE